MTEISTINALRRALRPVEALRGEHNQLEAWVRESFASLEQLHQELDKRQDELNRRERALQELDEAAESSAGETGRRRDFRASQRIADLEAEVERLRRQLSETRPRADELADKGAEKVEAVHQVGRSEAEMKDVLQAVRAQSDDLRKALAGERERSVEMQRQIVAELKELRQAIHLQRQWMDDVRDAAFLTALDGEEFAETIRQDDYECLTASVSEVRQRARARLVARQPAAAEEN